MFFVLLSNVISSELNVYSNESSNDFDFVESDDRKKKYRKFVSRLSSRSIASHLVIKIIDLVMGRHIVLLRIEWNRINVMSERIHGIVVLASILRWNKVRADLLLANGRSVCRLGSHCGRLQLWVTRTIGGRIVPIIVTELLRNRLIGGRHLRAKVLTGRLLGICKLFGISGALRRTLSELLLILKTWSRQRIGCLKS